MMTVLKTAILLLMLCCAVQLSTSAGPLADDLAKSVCCFSVNNVKIPKKKLESYRWTSSSCPLRHIVFETVKKRQFCMNPENSWAKLNKNHIDKKRASKSSK
ncbi:monocyte chemotactic protein 1B [Ctenopharyngodon idella]|uniref:Chemokine ligand 39 n=1 Tax=Ctenopharyngodon idella TaxID=7959 RepID=A0A345D722_CTEID|nr:monocyte chemotactic protein 1B [Ctenopharyngodon idella]AXF84152.1 chemokine ligand 39 [Ctenopharyngodon idella]